MLASDWIALAAMLISAGAVAFSLRSTPARVRNLLEATLKNVKSLEEDVASLRATWAGYREAIDSVLDEIAQTEERVEKNRRRVDQRARRAEKKENSVATDVDPHLALILKARATGAPV